MKVVDAARVRSRNEAGMVLVAVQVFVVLAFLALAPSYERLHALLRVEKASIAYDGGSVGLNEALGVGLSLLQTGLPPTDNYTCTLSLWDAPADQMAAFELRYSRQLTDRWQVQAEVPAGTAPPCPGAFELLCPQVSS